MGFLAWGYPLWSLERPRSLIQDMDSARTALTRPRRRRAAGTTRAVQHRRRGRTRSETRARIPHTHVHARARTAHAHARTRTRTNAIRHALFASNACAVCVGVLGCGAHEDIVGVS